MIQATTKNDDASDAYSREVERLVSRKEYKGMIPIVETSAHDNINVEMAFIVLAQLIDRSKGRSKIITYAESSRMRKDHLDSTTEAFQTLIRSHVRGI